jgi:hypothetical protein
MPMIPLPADTKSRMDFRSTGSSVNTPNELQKQMASNSSILPGRNSATSSLTTASYAPVRLPISSSAYVMAGRAKYDGPVVTAPSRTCRVITSSRRGRFGLAGACDGIAASTSWRCCGVKPCTFA